MSREVSLIIAPILVDTDTAAALLGIGRTKFDEINKSGELGPSSRKIGDRTLWSVDELKRWVDAGQPTRDKWTKLTRGKAA